MTKKSETLEFTRRYLRDKPDASFAEIRDAAAAEDLKIYPIVFGRAKALEGLVKVAPYGSKKKAKEAAEASAAASAAAKIPTPQPPPATGVSRPGLTPESIEAVISGMREHHEDRQRYRDALIRISEILDDVL